MKLITKESESESESKSRIDELAQLQVVILI